MNLRNQHPACISVLVSVRCLLAMDASVARILPAKVCWHVLKLISAQVRSATMFVDHSEDAEREGGVMSDIMAQIWDLVLDRHQHPCKADPRASKAAARQTLELLSEADDLQLSRGSSVES